MRILAAAASAHKVKGLASVFELEGSAERNKNKLQRILALTQQLALRQQVQIELAPLVLGGLLLLHLLGPLDRILKLLLLADRVQLSLVGRLVGAPVVPASGIRVMGRRIVRQVIFRLRPPVIGLLTRPALLLAAPFIPGRVFVAGPHPALGVVPIHLRLLLRRDHVRHRAVLRLHGPRICSLLPRPLMPSSIRLKYLVTRFLGPRRPRIRPPIIKARQARPIPLNLLLAQLHVKLHKKAISLLVRVVFILKFPVGICRCPLLIINQIRKPIAVAVLFSSVAWVYFGVIPILLLYLLLYLSRWRIPTAAIGIKL